MSARSRAPEIDFEEDPRYAIANREALWAAGYWLVFTLVVSGIAWILGGGKKAGDLQFVLGFPAWFFWSCLVATILLSLVPAWIVSRFFTDVSLSAHDEPTQER